MTADITKIQFAALRKGLLEFAVLAVVSSKKVYAAEILERLEGTLFATSEGSLYPLLSRLKREGLVAYTWAESGSGPPRKYYSLTNQGSKRLGNLRKYWDELSVSLQKIGESA